MKTNKEREGKKDRYREQGTEKGKWKSILNKKAVREREKPKEGRKRTKN